MSHTTETGTTFFHDGDFTGQVRIRRGDEEMIVPAADLIEFVAEIVRYRRITDLEAMEPRELLGLRPDLRGFEDFVESIKMQWAQGSRPGRATV